MMGGAPRAVWCTSENDPQTVSARSVAQTLDGKGTPVHVVWNPVRGELVQLLPATRAGLLIGEEASREGRACFQIMVVGFARQPFTHGHLKDLEAIMAWLDSWGVARRWPAGPPLDVPQAFQGRRDRHPWARGGHFGQSQVPGAEGPAPGGIDIRKLTGPDTPLADVPRPRSNGESTGVGAARWAPLHLEAARGL
jgi:hypothetical protein